MSPLKMAYPSEQFAAGVSSVNRPHPLRIIDALSSESSPRQMGGSNVSRKIPIPSATAIITNPTPKQAAIPSDKRGTDTIVLIYVRTWSGINRFSTLIINNHPSQ